MKLKLIDKDIPSLSRNIPALGEALLILRGYMQNLEDALQLKDKLLVLDEKKDLHKALNNFKLASKYADKNSLITHYILNNNKCILNDCQSILYTASSFLSSCLQVL